MKKLAPALKVLQKLVIPIVLIAFIASVVVAGYFYRKYTVLAQSPEKVAQEESNKLKKSLSMLMDLPSDEEPTIATVADKEKLKDQEFFKRADNGDKLFIYSKTGKVILFRPNEKRIIEVGQANFRPDNASGSAQQQVARVAILNGTKSAGLATTAKKSLEDAFKGQVSVTSTQNAKKTDYSETIVVDLTGNLSQAAEQLAQAVKGKVGSLPEGENKPADTEFLIIVGQAAPEASPVPSPSPAQ
jgi:hypothetical protein